MNIYISTILMSGKYHSVLSHQILLNQVTGQIFMNAPILEPRFPMIVVRHGQTDGNKNKKLQGQVDGPENQLNTTGKKQSRIGAQKLYAKLEKYLGSSLKAFARSGKLIILTSPISRAQDTAEIFITYFKDNTGILLDSTVETNLAEISFGMADGLGFHEIEDEQMKDQVLRYRLTQDATTDWNGTGESFLDVVVRAKTLLETLNNTYEHKDVIVIAFSHAIFSSALRTVVGEKSILNADNMIAFRNKSLENAEPFSLSPEIS